MDSAPQTPDAAASSSDSTPPAAAPSPLTAALVARRTRIVARRKMFGRNLRLALGLAIVVAVVLCTMIGARAYRHLSVSMWLATHRGGAEWTFEDEWRNGGSTDVRFGTRYFGPIGESPRGEDLRKLHDLYRVRSLQLMNCPWFGDADLAALRGLTSLRSLDLTRRVPKSAGWPEPIPKLTDAALPPVATLVNLNELLLTGNDITDDGLKVLAGLTKIEYLDLSETRVTDAGLEHLTGMTRLISLGVIGTKVTPAGVKRLQAALPGVEVDLVDDVEEMRKKDEARMRGKP